jgi:uncharacterized protein Yka (UPF0111/DUF47 family)
MLQDLVNIESIIQAILLMVRIINGIENFWNQAKSVSENTMVLTEMPFTFIKE